MASWSEGYLTDIDYTHGYFSELNPMRIKLAFLAAGLNPPEIETACELAFGQGITTNMHAAAGGAEWYGTDFVPSQAAFALQMARAGGAPIHLFDQSFGEFCARGDLPDFDFICLHGIFSWISDENRATIIDFVRRKLKVGGVLYISYNALPGWSAFAPLRHIISQHAKVLGSNGKGVVDKLNQALAFTDKFLDTNPGYIRAVPLVRQRFNDLRLQNPAYLAPEYLGAHWEPMYFSTVAELLAPAKLDFACSAHLPDHIDRLNLTAEQREMLAGIADPIFRQTIRDFMVNQQFRRDYWVKGPIPLQKAEINEVWSKLRFVLCQHRSEASLTITGALGIGSLSEAVYVPLLDILADHQPHSFGEIQGKFMANGLSEFQLREAVISLTGIGQIVLAQDDCVIAKARKTTANLNKYLLSRSKGTSEVNHLASPVTGGGINLGIIALLFLQSWQEGKRLPSELAEAALEILNQQGQRILKDGKGFADAAATLAEFNSQAITFVHKQLPVLKALEVAS